MAGIGDIFSSIGKALRPMGKTHDQSKPPSQSMPGVAKKLPPSSGQKPTAAGAGVKKPFDVNTYIKAVKLFGSDFFGKKVPMFFKNPGPYLKQAPDWFKKLPQDEQISYGVLGLGNVMFIVGLVLLIVL